jgi:hypothetical protein
LASVIGTTPCSTSPIGSETRSRPINRLLLLWILAVPAPVGAYETDQFSNRLEPIADSTEILNARVNTVIREIAEGWRGPRNSKKFVNRIFHTIGGHHWVDKLERWAMDSEKVERLGTPRRASIYSGHPLWATRVAALFGVGPTIKINGVLVGSDKIGHFLSQGRKYYRRYLRSEDEAKAGAWSAFTERAIFGQLTTGSYSNADLVANYEGYVFYRSLFEDDVIPGKPAILRWDGTGWEVQRPFDWADHVNAYWDEALNINHYDKLLYDHMEQRLLDYCDDFRRQPAMYIIQNEDRLVRRYAHLELRDTSELRLSRLCPAALGGQQLVTASREGS